MEKVTVEPNVIYSREEAAHILGISLSTLKRLIHSGQLRASRPAGLRRIFIKGASILEMLDNSVVEVERQS
jgi:excisionase family DNA binding protein